MTVQGPVKEQQPDGMSHRGGGGGAPFFQCIPGPGPLIGRFGAGQEFWCGKGSISPPASAHRPPGGPSGPRDSADQPGIVLLSPPPPVYRCGAC